MSTPAQLCYLQPEEIYADKCFYIIFLWSLCTSNSSQQIPDLILTKKKKKVFLELDIVPLYLFTAFEARVSAQFLLPTFEQFCGGITGNIIYELPLSTFARSALRQLGFLI